MKFEAIVGKGRKSIRKQVEDGFSNLPRGCYIELEKYAKEYILENLKQTDNNKRALIEMVRTFEEDTGLPLNLENLFAGNIICLCMISIRIQVPDLCSA